MAEKLASEKLDALVVSAVDSLAWLLNVRGNDLENTPFALGRAILRASGALTLFLHPSKLSAEVRAYLAAQASSTPTQGPGAAPPLIAFSAHFGAGFYWFAAYCIFSLASQQITSRLAATPIVTPARA